MEIKKALTFRASSIGDCLMAKYLLENIHAKFPGARCGIVIAGRGAMIRDLFAAYPWIEIIEANRRDVGAIVRLWLKYRGSDLVVTQYAGKPGGRFSLASKLMGRLLARRGGLVGFSDSSTWNKFLFSKTILVRQDQSVVWHEREILRLFDIPVVFSFPVLVPFKNTNILKRFNLETGRFIVAHLFSGNTIRGMCPEKKGKLLATVSKKFPDFQLVISGGTQDREEALSVVENIPAVVVAGEVTIQEMISLISTSHGVVSLDTGMAHIAAQLGVSLVVMCSCFGRNWWFSDQYGVGAKINVFSCEEMCIGGHVTKNYPDCINEISIEQVVNVI
ncbi:glycosyltransferase family 9 protein [Candidatus Nomurabacteria bacterium]|nr:glycosyltransferase family 9 protein [Candidatus Nomurabacteria bacterium]